MLERLGRLASVMHCLLLAITALLCYSVWWVRVPLTELDEAVYAGVAREMLAARDYIVPYFNQTPFYEKPVLLYWLQCLAMRLGGLHETFARLPSAVCSLVLVLLVYILLRHWLVRRTPEADLPARARARGAAFLSAFALTLTPMLGVWARMGTMDAITTFFTSGALLALLHVDLTGRSDNLRDDRRRLRPWYLLAAFSAGFAFLAKGPVGLLIPVLVWLIYHLLQRDLGEEVQRVPWLWMILVLLGTAAPWYVAIYLLDGPGFYHTFFLAENFARFAAHPREGHGFSGVFGRALGLLVYPPMALLLLFPLSAFLPRDLAQPFAGDTVLQRDPVLPRLRRFAWTWILTVIVFFSLSRTQLPSYIQAIAAGGALLFAVNVLARTGGPELPTSRRRHRNWARGLELGLLSLCGLLFSLLTVVAVWLSAGQVDLLKQIPPPVSLEAIPLSYDIAKLLTGVAVTLGITYQIGLWWNWRRSESRLIAWAVGGWVPMWLLVFFCGMLLLHSGYQRTVDVGQFLQSQAPNAQILVYHPRHPDGLVFYTRRRVVYYHEPSETLFTMAEKIAPEERTLSGMLHALAQVGRPALIVTDDPGLRTLTHYGKTLLLKRFGSVVVVRMMPWKG